MDYSELKNTFQKLNSNSPRESQTAHIIFTEDSFAKVYPLLSQTYRVSSDQKAFWPNMGGYSVFGDCLDGTDQGVRLDYYMVDEGIPDGWKVQYCYILEQMRDTAAISSVTRTEPSDGSTCFFFGDTSIRAKETWEDGKVQLIPITGEQVACGEWVDLPIDQVYGYCTLLAQHLNEERK